MRKSRSFLSVNIFSGAGSTQAFGKEILIVKQAGSSPLLFCNYFFLLLELLNTSGVLQRSDYIHANHLSFKNVAQLNFYNSKLSYGNFHRPMTVLPVDSPSSL